MCSARNSGAANGTRGARLTAVVTVRSACVLEVQRLQGHAHGVLCLKSCCGKSTRGRSFIHRRPVCESATGNMVVSQKGACSTSVVATAARGDADCAASEQWLYGRT